MSASRPIPGSQAFKDGVLLGLDVGQLELCFRGTLHQARHVSEGVAVAPYLTPLLTPPRAQQAETVGNRQQGNQHR
jgi:hypothetical protein